MKVATLIIALIFSTPASAQTIAETYDRFADITTIAIAATPLPRTQPPLRFDAYVASHGPNLNNPRLFVGTFRSLNDTWQFLRCHTVSLIVDNERLSGLPTQHSGRVASTQTAAVIESIQVDFTRSQIEQIAAARTVEGRLCTTEFIFPPALLAAFRDLVTRLPRP